jgi:hypothetical protein
LDPYDSGSSKLEYKLKKEHKEFSNKNCHLNEAKGYGSWEYETK